MEKLTKGNSILYNQLWINKAIEEGNINLIPTGEHTKIDKSIGEYIELMYNQIKDEPLKVNKHNSILYTLEWIEKYKEEGLRIPKYIPNKYSIGEILSLKYFERELLKPNPEEILYLKGEKIKKLEKK